MGILDYSNVRKPFKKLLKDAELPHIGFHGLRHTCAMLLVQGVAAKVVMESARVLVSLRGVSGVRRIHRGV
jgi:integrase